MSRVLAIFALLFTVTFSVFFMTGCGSGSVSPSKALNKAVDSAKLGNWDKAGDLVARVVKSDPNNVAVRIMQGMVFEHFNKDVKACDSYREAIKLDPKNFYAQYNLGRLLFEMGKYNDCVAPLKNAAKLDPKNINVIILLAQLTDKLQLNNSSMKLYKSLTSIDRFKNRPEAWNQLGMIYMREGMLPQAAKCFVQAYKLSPNNHIVVYNLAVFLDKYLGKYDKAVYYYKRYLKIVAKNPEMQQRRNEVLKRINEISH